jgi:murein DD-endopeptidase MepM/ murein hydrolase activator NlpD
VKHGFLLLLVLGLLGTAGVARGDENMFAVVAGNVQLPSPVSANGSDFVLAPSWMTSPARPVQLSSDQLLGIWKNAGQAYGVPWNVLASINKIESNFGRNMGPSSAGAIGWMQFMPSTWLRWGIDADGNGTADPWNPVDAIYSAARYLAASGAGSDIRQAVFSYNHAGWYVNEVIQLAQVYGGSDWTAGDAQPVFALDQLQSQLADAQAKVTKASDLYQGARAKAEELANRERALTERAEAEALLSDQLEAQKAVGQQGADAYAAQVEADRLEGELHAARTALADLQAQAQSASFNQPVGQILGGAPPQSAGSYVFPVGGGPAVVSVSHFHHDYPAADIAAPEGAPVYALADGTVLYAWSWDDRCGIGFTMRSADGQVWTYCHLSYLEPSVTQGAELKAGDPVGLVGATGHTTGPHLHLQLQPATFYPQVEQWFQSFAGTAFQWQDEAPTRVGSPVGPLVFHIVEASD